MFEIIIDVATVMSWNSSFRSLGQLLKVILPLPRNASWTKSCFSTRIEPQTNFQPSLAYTASVYLADRKGIKVLWSEEIGGGNAQEDYFHGVWLRDNCHCPLCLNDDVNQNTVDYAQLDDPSIIGATLNGEYHCGSCGCMQVYRVVN